MCAGGSPPADGAAVDSAGARHLKACKIAAAVIVVAAAVVVVVAASVLVAAHIVGVDDVAVAGSAAAAWAWA